jgi:hypothetical protein
VTAPDPLAAARAKLDARIAEAARALLEGVTDSSGRGATVKITIRQVDLVDLRAQVNAWKAFNETLGAES